MEESKDWNLPGPVPAGAVRAEIRLRLKKDRRAIERFHAVVTQASMKFSGNPASMYLCSSFLLWVICST